MSTGAKIAIFGGIAAFLLIGLLFAIGVVVLVANTAPSTPKAPRATKAPRVANNVGGVEPGRFPDQDVHLAPGAKPPTQLNTYIVDLKFEKDRNERTVQWQAKQKVRVTVNAENWAVNADGRIDVDLYIVDGTGQWIAWDNRPDMDCDVIFEVPSTGQYRIVVVLDSGARATCTVRY